jgi:hypothetical protein
MTEAFEESDLLHLVEDELDPADAAAIRRRLAEHPEVLGLIEQLRADRLALRSAEHPPLPQNFLAELEPILARPILMQPPPGAYRRRHRRRQRSRRLVRYAAAAAVLLLAGGGVWAMWAGLLPDGLRLPIAFGPTSDEAAPASTDATASRPGPVTPDPDLDGTIHHYQPMQRLLASASPPTPRPTATARPTGSPSVIAAPFALIASAAGEEIESALRAVATDDDAPVTLVRNFSYDEARDLQRRWALKRAASGTSAPEPRFTDLGDRQTARPEDASLDDLARRVREHMRDLERAERSAPPPNASGVLAGPAALAPSFEQQLDFSSHGAAYTLSVPIASLQDALERLSTELGGRTALRRLDPAAAVGEPLGDAGLEGWLADAPAIRASVRALESSATEAIVLVPVIAADAGGR